MLGLEVFGPGPPGLGPIIWGLACGLGIALWLALSAGLSVSSVLSELLDSLHAEASTPIRVDAKTFKTREVCWLECFIAC